MTGKIKSAEELLDSFRDTDRAIVDNLTQMDSKFLFFMLHMSLFEIEKRMDNIKRRLKND